MADGLSDLEALALAGAELCASSATVGDDDWDGPTPCADWSVGDLVDHVVGGNVFSIEILRGRTAGDALEAAMATFDDGYDRHTALVRTTEAQREAFFAPEALDGRYDHVAGRLTGVEVVRARVHDLIVHGWDLAQAIDPPATVPDALVEWSIGELRTSESLTARTFEIDADRVHDAPSLLAAFGRAP